VPAVWHLTADVWTVVKSYNFATEIILKIIPSHHSLEHIPPCRTTISCAASADRQIPSIVARRDRWGLCTQPLCTTQIRCKRLIVYQARL